MRVLVVDVGGTSVKILATGEKTPRQFPSGPTLTGEQMVTGVKTAAAGWEYDAVSVGFPGPVQLSAMRYEFGGHVEKSSR